MTYLALVTDLNISFIIIGIMFIVGCLSIYFMKKLSMEKQFYDDKKVMIDLEFKINEAFITNGLVSVILTAFLLTYSHCEVDDTVMQRQEAAQEIIEQHTNNIEKRIYKKVNSKISKEYKDSIINILHEKTIKNLNNE